MQILDEPATKHDVEEIVGRVVGDIVSKALQLISEQFVMVYRQFEFQNGEIKLIKTGLATIETKVESMERKLDATIAQTNQNIEEIRALRKALA